MSKHNGGFLTLLAGMAAGAAALFLSEKKNREKTQKVLATASKKAVKLKQEYDANPTAFKKKVAKEAQKTARVALKKAAVISKKAVKKNAPKVKSAAKKTAKVIKKATKKRK